MSELFVCPDCGLPMHDPGDCENCQFGGADPAPPNPQEAENR